MGTVNAVFIDLGLIDRTGALDLLPKGTTLEIEVVYFTIKIIIIFYCM